MNNNLAVETDNDKVIQLKVVGGKLEKKEVPLKKDGTPKKIVHNKKTNVSSEVYPLRTDDEVQAVMLTLDKRISEATNDEQEWIAYRNKLLFLIGFNVGIRASDLRVMKWNFFLNEDGTFKDYYTICPQKTSNKHKFVTLYFNQTVRTAIESYIELYPVIDYNDYVFKSRKGSNPITVDGMGKVIKSICKEAGIKQNVNTHTMRKTWSYNVYNHADDKGQALIILQKIFNHSSQNVTMHYIGILDDDINSVFNSINVGLDYI